MFWKIALCVRSALLILTEESWIWELPMTIIGLYFHLASIIISLTYLNSFALVSVFFVFFTNIVTRLFEDEKSIIVISSVVGTLMPFGGFMDNAIKTVLYTINLGNFHTTLHIITFLKVSKSWKQILKFSFEPKNNTNILYFYPSSLP